MSDTILNKLVLKSKPNGVQFSKEEMQMEYNELQSELDKRISDILHIIEFSNFSPKGADKYCKKLQSFLKKRRALKKEQNKYTPKTESGYYIINGKVTNKKIKRSNKQ